jgi:hypothetical protein
MITVFANFRINNKVRLDIFKLSFESIKNESILDNWVINCRGEYKTEVYKILKESLGEKLKFSTYESRKGWFFDSSKMLNNILNDFIFFWIEDHLKISKSFFNKKDLKIFSTNNIDYLQYSFTHQQRYKDLNPYLSGEDNNFYYYEINKNKSKHKIYTITAVGLFKKFFFTKIITKNHPILKRWPRNTPFDFEKTNRDRFFLPVKIALPKHEKFACIDDDHDQDKYSLISRGYFEFEPNLRMKLKQIEFKPILSQRFSILKYTPKFFKNLYRILLRIKYSLF